MQRYLAYFPLLIVVLVFTSCKQDKNGSGPGKESSDTIRTAAAPHSFSRPRHAVVKHLDLDITVNFQEREISGVAAWKIDNKTGTDSVCFDTRDLEIKKVYTGKDQDPVDYRTGKKVQYMGRPLVIPVDGESKTVKIRYSTSPGAEALQWLTPGQTKGGKHPFLFTQSQAILARTWIPLQDGPGIRFTYNARVKVPPELLALMSAENPVSKDTGGVYQFEMKQPIPAYLMALAVGDLRFRTIGENTGVYAEPGVIKDAAYEFGNLDRMMEISEKMFGPYRWEQYDLLVLPSSFPFGGMENPRLTFVTPTILAGDRSLTSLVAHELAHSWSGNLVTNATWNDFWLNEGFTVYFERRIMEEIRDSSYSRMLWELGEQDLVETINELGKNNPDTKLKLDLEHRDPDEGMNDIAYEKGAFLLKLIEEKAGRENFDRFLNSYFEKFAFQTMSSERFVRYYRENLIRDDTQLAGAINIKEWIYEPGLPENMPYVSSQRFAHVEKNLLKFQQGTPASEMETGGWTTHEWLHFLRHLPGDLSRDRMEELDREYHFTASGNSEIQAVWYDLAIRNDYRPAYDKIENFLVRVGRRKFLTPLYTAMAESDKKEWAGEIYKKSRPNYHAISRKTIDEVLNWKDKY